MGLIFHDLSELGAPHGDRGRRIVRLAVLLVCTMLAPALRAQQADETAAIDQRGPIHRAAAAGDIGEVRRLLDAGVDVNTAVVDPENPQEMGMTALIIASGAARSSASLVSLLLERGANVHAQTETGVTAILVASVRGDPGRVELLLEAGADPEHMDGYGNFPLRAAAAGDHLEVLELLLDAGADVNQRTGDGMTALAEALRPEFASRAVIDRLLEAGAEIGGVVDARGFSPLMNAAARGDAELVALFLDRGADVNGLNRYGATPLMAAAQSGTPQTIHVLIESGADVEARFRGFSEDEMEEMRAQAEAAGESFTPAEPDGSTALTFATTVGPPENVAALIHAGADLETVDRTGLTPLLHAAVRLNLEKVRLLAQAGADIEAAGPHGQTALMFATWNGHAEMTTYLIEKGAALDAVDGDGRTALAWAILFGDAATARLLLEAGADPAQAPPGAPLIVLAAESDDAEKVILLFHAGADVNAAADDGTTALIAAAGSGGHSALQALLEAGARVDTADQDGRQALIWAAGQGAPGAVRMLLDAGADPLAKDSSGHAALEYAEARGVNDPARSAIIEMLKQQESVA